MPGTVPLSGNLTIQGLADKLNRHEQLGREQVTGLVFDPNKVGNLLTTILQHQQLKPLILRSAGADQPGTKVLSTTVYLSGTKIDVDLYRTP